ncbi:inositol-pentakisphosphate 2-kinase [Ceratina calcarata]|uniref:Inositol-pentakisphosphate 2-kinase n=1 Tax=Ceratina calcarata TaxID=156304 RepID=A0AAJ7SDQ3_9HYME|nr:inositol-pentakisphosphate 2-kinase [Ceratina calcarata]XP_017892330.1 inositol-pentakisphosphate 2-kinase [Ceratina calcarata]XP_017892331.1 inositol-pentakisphosphate 2-kinase [Ceratina calcarata]XP_017892333.1 inositol-pentakisphosphate 2-kinase [Ceratina calcarata]XP_026675381.1 inositol-pentakisphosphate 2-kinase [Ceratina calcarata]XP_026675382.1 inositol-pentakisphosphate 2-kinase [Ceratina calcarata]XP_026675383.1 inositol-pentakisphosphate 2-kinase [Ceratina calcarata]
MDEGNSVVTTSTGNSVNVTRDTISEPVSTSFTTLSVVDCVYKGEGNSNIVIALPKERKVIRLRKLLPQDGVSPENAGLQRVKREVEFVQLVASCFLGPYVRVPEIVRLNIENVRQLLEVIRHSRPDGRRWKKTVDIHATKYPDYTFLQRRFDSNRFVRSETFCVEVKPKQGYLQNDNTSTKNIRKCPYCLMQYLKLKNGTIKERSSYCPLDLFSGVKTRMKQALRGLLKSPQNNLKIFKDGEVVYGNGSSTIDLERILKEWFQRSDSWNCSEFQKNEESTSEHTEQFCDLIHEALSRSTVSSKDFNRHRNHCKENHGSYDDDDDDDDDSEPIPYIDQALVERVDELLKLESCNWKGEQLPNDSVLGRILEMQKVPFVSAEHVYNAYSKHRESLTDDTIHSSLTKTHELGREETSDPEQESETGTTRRTSRLQNYLLFTCARDCSILMSFRETNPRKTTPGEDRDDTTGTPPGSRFVWDIGITDTEPKSLRCIEKHRERDTEILKSIVSVLEGREGTRTTTTTTTTTTTIGKKKG